MADMADSGSGSKLFVRQSSGLVRNVSVTNALFFKDANTWFTDSSGAITGTPGFIASLVVLALITAVVLLPTRSFHRFVTILAAMGVAGFALMFVFGLLATSGSDFQHNLPQYTG